ncbi:MAG TPA: hypothetical protein VKZ72_10495 [Acidimicrobiales bacterium]|jgi:polyhydroxyalkanoate synthesis regulator phasin|nr:hypothetical protein [Acidimicrobiales bacterium]
MAENDLLKRLLDAGMTFTALTRQRAEELVRDLVRAGAVQAEQAQSAVEELLERSRHNRDRLLETVRSEIDQQISRLDLATREDIERMVQRVLDTARSFVGQATGQAAGGGAGPKPEAPAAVTEAPSATAPAEKATKKSTKKKTTAGKPAARKSSTSAKKAAAKKATAKRAPAAKAPAGKAATGKASTRKAATRRSAATKGGAGGSSGTSGGAGAGSAPPG